MLLLVGQTPAIVPTVEFDADADSSAQYFNLDSFTLTFVNVAVDFARFVDVTSGRTYFWFRDFSPNCCT